MVVVGLDLRPVQRAAGGQDGQAVALLDHARAAAGQFRSQARHPFALLQAQRLQVGEFHRAAAQRREHHRRHDAVPKLVAPRKPGRQRQVSRKGRVNLPV